MKNKSKVKWKWERKIRKTKFISCDSDNLMLADWLYCINSIGI